MIYDANKDPRLAEPSVDVLHNGRSIKHLAVMAADTTSGWCLVRTATGVEPALFLGVTLTGVPE